MAVWGIGGSRIVPMMAMHGQLHCTAQPPPSSMPHRARVLTGVWKHSRTSCSTNALKVLAVPRNESPLRAMVLRMSCAAALRASTLLLSTTASAHRACCGWACAAAAMMLRVSVATSGCGWHTRLMSWGRAAIHTAEGTRSRRDATTLVAAGNTARSCCHGVYAGLMIGA